MTTSTLEERIDQIMQEYVSADTPGVALLIGRDDRVLVRKAYGLANLETGERLTPDHRFVMASVTKQFTSTCIMLLRYRGLLQYDEPVARFFPSYPDWKHKVTIRHLLNQTSGIPEYLTPAFWEKTKEHGDSVNLTGVLALIGGFMNLEFAPGSNWRYCNSNYVMLGSIIEQAAGMTFRDFMQQNVLGSLGMVDSFAADSGEVPERQATGYEWLSKTEFKLAPFNQEVVGWADGNLISTLDDMFLWAESLSTDKIVPLAEKAQMFVPWNPLNASMTRYGFGQTMGERRGVREIHHGGGTLGYNTRLMRFPDEHLTVIMLSNGSGIGLDVISGAIAEELVGEKMVPISIVKLPEEFLLEKCGMFAGKPRDTDMTMSVDYSPADHKLLIKMSGASKPVEPLGRDLFLVDKLADRYVEFVRDKDVITGVLIKTLGNVIHLPYRLA